MKGFIEVTGNLNKLKVKMSINVNQIVAVTEFKGKTSMNLVNCDEAIAFEESYEEIKAKIAEAVGEKGGATDTNVGSKTERGGVQE